MKMRSLCGLAAALWAAGASVGAAAPGEAADSSEQPARNAELFTAERAAEEDLLVVLPRAIEMGMVPIGDERHRRVWVINPSESEELRIKAVRFDCGCTTAPGFQVMTLEPGEARAVDLEIHAPMEVGTRRDVRVFYVLENGDAVFSTVHLETVDTCSGFSIDPPMPEDDVLALPGEIGLGDLPLGVRTEFTAWFVNQSDEPRQIEKLKTSCGCLSAPGFESGVIEPGRAVRVDLVLRPEMDPLDERRVRLVAMDAGGVMAEMSIVYSVGMRPVDDGWETVTEPNGP